MTSPGPELNVAWPKQVEPGTEVTQAIREACTGNLGPARGLSATVRFGLSVLLSGSVVVILMVDRLGRMSSGAIVGTTLSAVGWGMVQAAVLFVGLARPPGHRGRRSARWAIALGVPVLFMGYLSLIARHATPPGAYFTNAGVHRTGLCGLHVLLLGALATSAVFLVWRRTDPLSPGLSGALTGLSGGLVGAVAMGFTCPCGQLWHLWLAHGLGVAVLTAAGWLAGRRWLTP
jgi:hypothetical protein